MLNLQITNTTIELYKKEKLNFEYFGTVLFILHALYNNQIDLLEEFDGANENKQVLILYRYLVRKNLIEETEDEEQIYTLTNQGIDFVKSTIPGTPIKVTPEIKVETTVVKIEDVSEWVQDWINLFPQEKVEGRYLRSSKFECTDRLRWFIKEYQFNKDTIFKATKEYLKSQVNSNTGHMYTRNASYFIFKGRSKQDRTSDLATWCERVLIIKDTNKFDISTMDSA